MHCGSGCRLGLCSSGYRIYGAVGIPVWRDPLPRHCHGHSGKLQHMQSAAYNQWTSWQVPGNALSLKTSLKGGSGVSCL